MFVYKWPTLWCKFYCVQFEARQMKFVSDKVVARNELGVKKGQLTYLKNLAKVISTIMPK